MVQVSARKIVVTYETIQSRFQTFLILCILRLISLSCKICVLPTYSIISTRVLVI